MAIICANLSTQPERLPAVTHFVRGYIPASTDTLEEHFGDPDCHDDAGMGEWTVRCPAGDLRLSQAPGQSATTDASATVSWQIQAATDDVLPWIYRIIMGTTVGFQRAVEGHVGESTLETLTSAYSDFLWNQVRSIHDWLLQRNQNSDDYEDNRHVPLLLGTLQRSVFDRLLDYRWAVATSEERKDWANMATPSRGSSLADWHGVARWLYIGCDAPLTWSGRRDLAAGLLECVERRRAVWNEFSKLHRVRLDRCIEAADTLRALATMPVFGVDGLGR